MFSDISWFTFITSLSIVLVGYLLYSFIIKPYRQYRLYQTIISSHYKVFVQPYFVLPTAFFKRQNQNVQKYGDSQYTTKFVFRQYDVRMNVFLGNIVLQFIDPQLVREFYERTMEGCYVKSMRSLMLAPIKQLLGNGLLFSEQGEWRMKRKIMSSVFNYDFIKSKVDVFSSIATEILDKIENSQGNKDKKEVKMDVSLMLQEVFGNVVIKCFFGDINLYEIEGKTVFEYFSHLMELNLSRSKNVFAIVFGQKFTNLNLRSADREVNKLALKFKEYATNVINDIVQKKTGKTINQAEKDQKQKKVGVGVVDLLIKQNRLKDSFQAKKVRKQQKNFYTIDDLIDEFKTFFFAGTDTTANNTTILIYLLSKYKDFQEKIRKQIKQIIGDSVQNITFDKLKDLKYLQKVQKETLRMYSPSNGIFKRDVVKQHFIGKIPIKPGMMVSILLKPNHFKESFYDHPQVFNPDRWDTIDQTKIDPFSYFPFSSGLRNCIGQHLAMVQSKIVVIHLLLRYKEIILQKPDFRLYYRTLYGAEAMTTTFVR